MSNTLQDASNGLYWAIETHHYGERIQFVHQDVPRTSLIVEVSGVEPFHRARVVWPKERDINPHAIGDFEIKSRIDVPVFLRD